MGFSRRRTDRARERSGIRRSPGRNLSPGLVTIAIILAMFFPAMASAAGPIDVPDITAGSVFAYDLATGETIYTANADERRPVASLSKIMTALVTLDYRAPDAEVVVTEADMIAPGYSTMWLQVGDTLTVEQLLTGVLLPSGGDAARALARDIGTGLSGTDDPEIAVAAFVDAMNQRAADLGLEDTQFANPDGDDADDAWSTAHDVALMFGAVQEHELLTGILAQSGYGFVSVGPEQRAYGGQSTNQLVGQYGVTGAKTGSTEVAGGCLVLARTTNEGGSAVIIALLGSNLAYDDTGLQVQDDRWSDATTLIDDMDTRWRRGEPAAEPEIVPTGAAPANAAVPVGDAASAPVATAIPARTEQVAANGDREPFRETFVIGLAGGMLAIVSGSTWIRLRTGRSQPQSWPSQRPN